MIEHYVAGFVIGAAVLMLGGAGAALVVAMLCDWLDGKTPAQIVNRLVLLALGFFVVTRFGMWLIGVSP